jgi:N-acetyl-gamma-glutamyl-phosphate reductase
MIAEYESGDRDTLFDAPRQYGLSQTHKHLPEMAKICSLDNAPSFMPVVAPYYSGMEVTVPLFADQLLPGFSAKDILEVYSDYYRCGVVKAVCGGDESGFLSASAFSGRDDMQIGVFGNEERILLVSRFDNLGKGASGAAIQNMNIMFGIEETTGLVI